MNVLLKTFLENQGIAQSLSCVENQNLILFGGFIDDFAKALQSVGADLNLVQKDVFLLHPVSLNPYSKVTHFLYEVGCEEAIVALLTYAFSGKNINLDKFVESLDVGYLASECNLCEEELEIMQQSCKENGFTLLIGKDLQTHKNAENIARILALLSKSNPKIKIVFLEESLEEFAKVESEIEPLEELESYDGLVVYLQKDSTKPMVLEVSKQFSLVSKIQDNAKVAVHFEELKAQVQTQLQCNAQLKGMVGILWIPNEFDLEDKFCYQCVKLSKVA